MGLDVYLYQKKELSYNKETSTRVVEEKLLWDCDTHELGEQVVGDLMDESGTTWVTQQELLDWCETQLKGEWEDGDIHTILQLKDVVENDTDKDADLELHNTY